MVYPWEVGTVRCPICSKSLFQVLSLNFSFLNIYKDVIKIKTFENISYPHQKKKKKNKKTKKKQNKDVSLIKGISLVA